MKAPKWCAGQFHTRWENLGSVYIVSTFGSGMIIAHSKVVTVSVIALVMTVAFTTAQFPKFELKKSKNFLTIPVSVIRHRAKELRSWRLNNLVDYITGGKRKVHDIAKPKVKSLGKIKGMWVEGVSKKIGLAKNLAINKKSTIVVQSLWNMAKIFISLVDYVVGISVWLEQNCGYFIKSQVFGQSNFFWYTFYLLIC